MQKMTQEYCLPEVAEALEVSRGGFHAHEEKDQGRRRQRDKHLLAVIGPLFLESRRTYGSPRITRALRNVGERCGKNRVARLVRQLGLRAKQKRRFRPRTPNSAHRLPVAENWLARMPAADRPNQIWIGDITYITTAEGWLSFRHPRCLFPPVRRLACRRLALHTFGDKSLEEGLQKPAPRPRALAPFRSRDPVCQRRVQRAPALLWCSRLHEP